MADTQNRIPEKQNTERFVEYLAASSRLYSRAKTLTALQVILTVPLPLAFSVLAILFPGLKVWAAFYGVTIPIFDAIFIERLANDCKKQAAKIQERFDCDLLELDWNHLKAGDEPTRERIHRAAKKYNSKKSNQPKVNWYSRSVEKLPLLLARIVCQRSSILWDTELRRTYTNGLIGMACGLGVAAPLVGLALKMSMEVFVLSILAPIFPTLLWVIREIKKQREAIGTQERLMRFVEGIWKDALDRRRTDQQLGTASRELQDEIYLHRSSNQPVFNWVYNLMRTKQEDEMAVGVEEMVEQAIGSLAHQPPK